MTIGLCCSQPARRPHLGLTASWCTYGRRFAPRFFPLHLAATRCGSLRLPSSAPVGSFHPTRFCPCWAHWGRLVACGGLSTRPCAGWQPVRSLTSCPTKEHLHPVVARGSCDSLALMKRCIAI